MKRRAINMVLCLSIFVLLTGCQPENYQFRTINGQNYIVLQDVSQSEPDASFCVAVPYLRFSSMDEFVDRVVGKKLDEKELRTLAGFPRDEEGIKVCDFSNLCELVVPTDLSISGVSWSGEYYGLAFKGENLDVSADFDREDYYRRNFTERYAEWTDNPLVTVTKQEKVSDRDAVVTYYTTSTGQFKEIQYSFSQNGTQYFVKESYALSMDFTNSDGEPPLPISDTVPYTLRIFVENGVFHCEIAIRRPAARPSESWLKEFSIGKYVPPGSKE